MEGLGWASRERKIGERCGQGKTAMLLCISAWFCGRTGFMQVVSCRLKDKEGQSLGRMVLARAIGAEWGSSSRLVGICFGL